mgnify:CR=1 FL=1
MKKLIYLFLVLGLFACSNESVDEGENNNNDDQNTSGYTWGIIEDDGYVTNSGNYVLWLNLYSDGIEWDCPDGEGSGSGKIMYFEMFTSNSGIFDEGTYNYSSSFGEMGTWDLGEYTNNASAANPDDTNWVELTSGTVTIAKDGSTYSISWDCATSSGFGVSGSYTGSLEYCDTSGD